jgi:hypothetical protein
MQLISENILLRYFDVSSGKIRIGSQMRSLGIEPRAKNDFLSYMCARCYHYTTIALITYTLIDNGAMEMDRLVYTQYYSRRQ